MTTDPNWRRPKPRPDWYEPWLASLPADVAFCRCSGVTWMLRDPRTSRPCRTCGQLRNDDRCVVATSDPRHKRLGCRSTDEAHIDRAIDMMMSDQLESRSLPS